MGRPDAERRGRPPQYPPATPYDALGYGCHKKYTADSFQLQSPRPPFCRTIFWIDAASGRLETFYTSERRFIEGHRVRVGMPAAVASPTSAGVPQAIASCSESGTPSPTLGSTNRSAAW